MSKNITTTATTTEFAVTAARAAYSTLKRVKGQRPQAVKAFLDADTNDQRDEAIEAWGAGFVRRGLREAAVFLAAHDDEEAANAFWTLRDSIDEDEFLDFDTEVVEDVNVAA
jgi:hypothetical protein